MNRRRLPLYLYLAVLVSLLTLGLTSVLSLYSYYSYRDRMLTQTAAGVDLVLENISIQAKEYLFTEAYPGLNLLVREYANNPLIHDIDIFNQDSMIIASLDESRLGIRVEEGETPILPLGEQILYENGIPLLQRSLQIAQGSIDLGRVNARINLSQVYEGLARLGRAQLVFGLSFWIVSIIISFLGARFLVSPLEHFAAAISKVGRGEYELSTVNSPVREFQTLENGFLAMARNISQREAAEKEARQMAERANRAKSSFLANTSHELRTPLNAIIGFAELLADEPLSPHQRESLEHIRYSASGLSVMIRNLLDLVEIESGTVKIHSQLFDLHDLVRELDQHMKAACSEKGLEWKLNSSLGNPCFMGDRDRIEQICMILLNNALEYTLSGQIVMEIAHGKDLEVRVSDSGPGIARDQSRRLFESFSQFDDPLTKSHRGMGAGLYIASQFLKAMGGEIRHESPVLGGSLFSFRIPPIDPESAFSSGPDSCTDEAISATANGDSTAEAYTPPVLVVEDDPLNRLYLQRLLSREGYRCILAPDGESALMEFCRQKPRLVLMDIGLPGKDGIEVAKELAALDAGGTAVPIIPVSANVQQDIQERCREAGMQGFVSKPVKPALLLTLIRDRLQV